MHLKNFHSQPTKHFHDFLTKLQHSVGHCKLHLVGKCTEMHYPLFHIWFFVWMWLQSLFLRFHVTAGVFSLYINIDCGKCKLKYSGAVLKNAMRGNRVHKQSAFCFNGCDTPCVARARHTRSVMILTTKPASRN